MRLRHRNEYSSLKLYRNEHNFNNNPIVITQEDAENKVADLSKGMLALLKQVIFFSNKYPSVYISQIRFAKLCGLSREYVNRCFSKFEVLGILKMLYRHKRTSMYKLTDVFTKDFIAKISIYFRVFPLTLLLSITAPNAALEKRSLYIQKVYNYINNRPVEREFTTARVHENGGTGFKKKQEVGMLLPSDKKKILEQLSQGIVPNNFPSETVRSITELSLSRYGQVKLSAFPDFIIKQALQEMRTMKHLKQPFNYLFARCMALCKSHQIKPDFAWVDALRETLKMGNDKSPVIDKSVRTAITLEHKLASQWKPDASRVNLNKEEQLRNAAPEMEAIVKNNPGLLSIIGSVLDKIKANQI